MESLKFDDVVRRFVQQLSNGDQPHIESYLASSNLPLADQGHLFSELLYEEVYHSLRIGHCPSLDHYRTRFPNFESEVMNSWQEANADADRVKAAPEIKELADPSAETSTHDPLVTISPIDAAQRPPPTIPGFEIIAEINRGGMGVVYKARQISLNRIVAIKVILAADFADSKELKRFRMEAEAQAHLQHPNIVQMFESGEHLGHPYLCMEFVDGRGLNSYLRDKRITPREAAQLVEKLARAIESAHKVGIIHRDLKPSNVLITADGEPKITDFGLAKRLDSSTELTNTGAILGTPGYMAPEQAAGHGSRVGALADVYGLGTILYELLTSKPPFSGTDILEIIRQVLTTDPVVPRSAERTVPADLETICLKCLEKNPLRRYGSAAALADDLRRFLRNEEILARRANFWERIQKFRRRNVAAFWLMLALAITAVISTALAVNAYHSANFANRERRRSERLVTEFTEQRKLCSEVLEPLAAEITRISKRGDLPDEIRRLLRQTNNARELVSAALSERDRNEGTIENLGANPLDDEYRLSDSLIRTGTVYYYHITDYPRAVEKHREALSWLESLPVPADAEALFKYKSKLAAALARLGVSLGRCPINDAIETGETRSKHIAELFERALKLRREAYALRPDSVDALEAISYSLNNLADHHDEFADYFKEALDIRRRVLVLRPDDKLAALNVAVSLNNCAKDCAKRDIREALSLHREAVSTCELLVNRDPNNLDARFYLGLYYGDLGKTLAVAGQSDEGIRLMHVGIDELKKCHEAKPLEFEYPSYITNLNEHLYRICEDCGKREEAIAVRKVILETGKQMRRDGFSTPRDEEIQKQEQWLRNPATNVK